MWGLCLVAPGKWLNARRVVSGEGGRIALDAAATVVGDQVGHDEGQAHRDDGADEDQVQEGEAVEVVEEGLHHAASGS